MLTEPIEVVYGPPQTQRLSRMVEDAQLLQSFAVRCGTKAKLPEDFHSRFGQATEALVTRLGAQVPPVPDPLPALETAFLTQYEALAEAMGAISAQSIRYTVRANDRHVFWPTVLVTAWALVVFVLIVVLQGYWAVGARFVDQAGKQGQDREKLFERASTIEDSVARLNRRLKALPAEEQCQERETAKTRAGQAAPTAEALRRCTQAEQNRKDFDSELDRLLYEQRPPIDRETNRLNDQWSPVVGVLDDLYVLERKVYCAGYRIAFFQSECDGDWQAPFRAEKKAVALDKEQREKDINTRSAAPTPTTLPTFFAERIAATRDQRLKANEDRAKALTAAIEERRSRALIHRIAIALDILQTYAVPALMGLLGALIFVLRDLGTRLRTYAYVPDSLARGVGRIVVGTIAGVLAGWLLPSTDSIAKSIPPLVIPFMFGYSVEVLFRLLDKLIEKVSPGA